MKPFEIVKGIYWVGAVDWNIRDFHGYSTELGTTYNAYLIVDEKVTLIDTVKSEFTDELMANIATIIDPKKIDFVISNHTEMDHSGGLPNVMHRIGEGKPVYCSKKGYTSLPMHFGKKLNYQKVEEGDVLSLGKRTLRFLDTPMLHWPDSMFTYVQEENLLFSSDAFGQHFASTQRFDDEVGEAIMPHAKKYFANILMPYSSLILKLVEKVKASGLKLDIICPDHGIMWRGSPSKIIEAYVNWSTQTPKRKAIVVYDTMWHSTQKMAETIVDTLAQYAVEALPIQLRKWHRSDVVTEALDAGAILIGSPTLNNGIFPTVADFMTYLKGLRPINKLGAAFGSYGWSGEAVKILTSQLEDMRFNVLSPGVKIPYVPDDQALNACRELSMKVAEALPGL